MRNIKKILCTLLCSVFLLSCGTQKPELPKANMSGYENLKTNDHHFKEYSMDKLLKDMEDKNDGFYYMGYLDCPWCQDAVPVLEKAAKEAKVDINYIAIRDKDMNRTYSKEKEKRFKKLVNDRLSENKEGEKTIYVPYVFVLKDGEIIQDYVGTLDTYDVNERELNEKEELLLKRVYQTMMELF